MTNFHPMSSYSWLTENKLVKTFCEDNPIQLYANFTKDFKQNNGKIYSILNGDELIENLSFDSASKKLGIILMGSLLSNGLLAP